MGNVLTNDTDPDGPHSALFVSKVNGLDLYVGQLIHGAYGDLTLNSKGDYTYTETQPLRSAASTGAVDQFSYSVSDGHGGTASSTLNVTVDLHAPSAVGSLAVLARPIRESAFFSPIDVAAHLL
ncbi:Ig-like domain-containing protein [Bradyrhizobium sp. 2S1]|uniref:Ig-like domain-containing protein n=1 Tax=Bradyrhizobium sp. 2S1 TaxID=1404429 RepID=UPI002003BADD|nr:cadherin-like domain-containing protein [Bradyrhizobium sp. 2S1]